MIKSEFWYLEWNSQMLTSEGTAFLPAVILYVFLAGDMLDLLKWRTHPDKIAGCLSKLKEIDGSEIVKVHIIVFLFPLE